MNWDLTGKTITGSYYGMHVTGVVESSRVKYGAGDVQHTVNLSEPVKLPWRDQTTTRILLDNSEASIFVHPEWLAKYSVSYLSYASGLLFCGSTDGGWHLMVRNILWATAKQTFLNFYRKITAMDKIDQAIEYVKDRLEGYQNPSSYCESEYYDRCAAKAAILEEVLSTLEQLKKGK
jgi:hypothetical protein